MRNIESVGDIRSMDTFNAVATSSDEDPAKQAKQVADYSCTDRDERPRSRHAEPNSSTHRAGGDPDSQWRDRPCGARKTSHPPRRRHRTRSFGRLSVPDV